VTDKDGPAEHLLSRREIVAFLGATGAVWLAGGSLFSGRAVAGTLGAHCVVRPEQTGGPYFVDERLNRSDIRSDPTDGRVRPGTPLTLTLLVSRLNSGDCQPLPGVQVDIWHCDAQGIYSDVQDPDFSTIGQKFLRGYQNTDASGSAKFMTIYPGWYQGRAVHIHFKIRPTASSEFTSQLFFDDTLSTQVFAQAPYSQKGTQGITRNAADGIFQQSAGKLLLNVTKSGDVYSATFDIGLAS